MMTTRPCYRCGSTMEMGTTTYVADGVDGEAPLVSEHAPALICPRCGERAYPSATVAEIERIVAERPSPTRTMTVCVYDLEALSTAKASA